MPERIIWNDGMVATIRDMRQRGENLDAIGAALGLSRTTVGIKARQLAAAGVNVDLPKSAPLPQRARGYHDRDGSHCMLAGDPVPWGILTAGTLLDGVPYPVDPVTRQPRAAGWK